MQNRINTILIYGGANQYNKKNHQNSMQKPYVTKPDGKLTYIRLASGLLYLLST